MTLMFLAPILPFRFPLLNLSVRYGNHALSEVAKILKRSFSRIRFCRFHITNLANPSTSSPSEDKCRVWAALSSRGQPTIYYKHCKPNRVQFRAMGIQPDLFCTLGNIRGRSFSPSRIPSVAQARTAHRNDAFPFVATV